MNRSRRALGRATLALPLLVCLVAFPARAAELHVELAVDAPVTLGAAAIWVSSEVAKASFAPSACRWCEPNALDDTTARALRWNDLGTPARISDAGLVAVPLLALGAVSAAAWHDDKLEQAKWDMLLVAESAAVTQVLNQATKFAVGRERPFVHWLAGDAKGTTAQPSDNNLSFFSGHTSFTFALATSAWSVARLRGYSWATPILAVGAPLAAFVGYLRMGAGKHYLTDVLTGAAIGTACGVLVPALHEARTGEPAAGRGLSWGLAPTDGGAVAVLAWSR